MNDYVEQYRYSTLRLALENYTVDNLKKYLAVFNTSERPARKSALVDAIAAQMEGDKLRAAWNRLDSIQQAAVAEVLYSPDGIFSPDRFYAKYGKNPDFGKKRQFMSYDSTPSLLAMFLHHGMLPDDLRERLKAFVPAPAALKLETQEDVPPVFDLLETWYDYQTKKRMEATTPLPIVQRDTERDALQDVQVVLRLISAGKVNSSDKTNLPTAGTVKALGALLHGGDFYDNMPSLEDRDADEDAESEEPVDALDNINAINPPSATPRLRAMKASAPPDSDDQEVGPMKAFAWPLLVQAGRLAAQTGKKLGLTPAGQKALSNPPAETLRALWQQWLKSTLYDELRRINAIRGQTGNGQKGLTSPKNRRDAIVQMLRKCPVDRWVPIDALLRNLHSEHDFEVTRDAWSLYISEAQYGSLGYNYGDGNSPWNLLQARYALCFLFEYAATLGLIDVAYTQPAGVRHDYSGFWGTDDLEFFSRYDGLLYVRLNALGAYCLGLSDTYVLAPHAQRPTLRVLPNRDIVITDMQAATGDLLVLTLYTEKTSERVYHLDQAKMLAAVESGRDLKELRELLTARGEGELPAVIVRFLDDVEERSRRVLDRGVARLIECADAVTAQLLANDPRTKRYCLAAGERHLVVTAENEAAFRKGLRQVGYILPTAGTGR